MRRKREGDQVNEIKEKEKMGREMKDGKWGKENERKGMQEKN